MMVMMMMIMMMMVVVVMVVAYPKFGMDLDNCLAVFYNYSDASLIISNYQLLFFISMMMMM